MGKIVLDDALKAKLAGLTQPTELCDTDGRPVGHFLPYDDFIRETYEWAKTEVTDEELDRASREEGGSTLAEIKKRWGWA